MIDLQELYWAAGFLEGEGSFILSTQSKTRAHSIAGGLAYYATASQVQREPLERLLRLFGGRINHYKPANPKAQTAYRWTLNGKRGLGLMMTLYKIMSPGRQKQILKVLSAWKSAQKQGWRNKQKTHCPSGHQYSPDNTYWNGGVRRCCRECRRLDSRARRTNTIQGKYLGDN